MTCGLKLSLAEQLTNDLKIAPSSPGLSTLPSRYCQIINLNGGKMRFQNKVVLVTGAARGIGAACARRFAQEGAMVVVHYQSNLAAAEAVATSISADGGEAKLVRANLAELTEIDRFVDTAAQAFGSLHILVNNAGIGQMGSIDTVEPDNFHHLNCGVLPPDRDSVWR
jgi:short chain dehydrogenase